MRSNSFFFKGFARFANKFEIKENTGIGKNHKSS
jgi:hypothetical protein